MSFTGSADKYSPEQAERNSLPSLSLVAEEHCRAMHLYHSLVPKKLIHNCSLLPICFKLEIYWAHRSLTLTCLLQAKQNLAAWAQWQVQAREIRKSLGVPVTLCPWTGHPMCFQLQGLQATPRILEILDLAVLQKAVSTHQGCAEAAVQDLKKLGTAKSLKTFMSDVYADVSQNPCRQPWTNRFGVSKCLTTSTHMYAFARDRIVLPLELLFLQGHTREVRIPSGMSQNSIRNLAGEGMNLACLGSLLYCLRLTDMLGPR